MKPAKERLSMSLLTPEQLKTIKPRQFSESQEYSVWKRGIVRRRLELIDRLLSLGEWISNTRMMEEINELYLDAPNEYCYQELTPPHRLIESKEGSRKRFESALSLMFAGTIRQDRFALNNILRIVGKEHIFEKKDGEGIEGWYRYNTKYSIFEKYTINDIEFDDYELANSIPIVLDTIQTDFKVGNKDSYLEEATDSISTLDLSTINSISLLSAMDKALKQARTINKNRIENILEKVVELYDEQKKGWEREYLKAMNEAYIAASHPAADVEQDLLFHIRLALIDATIRNREDGSVRSLLHGYANLLPLLKKVSKDIQDAPELCDEMPEFIDIIAASLKHYSFVYSDYELMTQELEAHYSVCKSNGLIYEDYALLIAINRFIYPQEWIYSERLYECLNNLIAFYHSDPQESLYRNWMLLLFYYLRFYLFAANNGFPPSSFSELTLIRFKLISSFEPDDVVIMVAKHFPEDEFHDLLNAREEIYHTQFVEVMVLQDLRFDMSEISRALIHNNYSKLEGIPTDTIISIYTEMLRRFCHYSDVIPYIPKDALLNCRLSLALIHDHLGNKDALSYYHAVEHMVEAKEWRPSDDMLFYVKDRIATLSGQKLSSQ